MKRSGFRKKPIEEIIAKKREAVERAVVKKKAKMSKVSSKDRKQRKSTKSAPSGGKKRGKSERKKLEDKIWVECRRIIRERHGNTCYTCGATGLESSNWQTGHGKPKGALPIHFQYDLRNLRPQCMNDNIHLGGMSDIFIAKLEQEEEGLQFLQEACRKTEDGWIIKKESKYVGKEATIYLQSLLEEYKNL